MSNTKYICDCNCHISKDIVHCRPCCYICPKCGERIVTHMYKDHIENCKESFDNKCKISEICFKIVGGKNE
jgi:Cft2 family RNA processing exonuclease